MATERIEEMPKAAEGLDWLEVLSSSCGIGLYCAGVGAYWSGSGSAVVPSILVVGGLMCFVGTAIIARLGRIAKALEKRQ